MTARVLLFAALLGLSALAQAERYTIPWFVSADAGGAPQGVLRIGNGTGKSGSAEIVAIDDAGARTGPVTLELNPWAAVELTATELQSGNAAKGLANGFGNLSGDVRLLIDSDVAIVPSAYVRSGGGALAAVHDTVLEATEPGRYRYDVAIFHPSANVTQQSRLRLINPGGPAARILIEARDDAGMAASGGTVELTLPAGAAQTLTAQQLAAGDPAVLTGRLGAGVGNWRLSVTSDLPIQAVNVTVGSGGDWSNLSTSAVTGWAPEDEASFEARFLDRVIVSRDGLARLELRVLAGNRFRDTRVEDGVEDVVEGDYRYRRTGRDAGQVSFGYDGLEPCTARFYFDSSTAGWYTSGCIDTVERVEDWTGGTWVGLDSGAMPVDLGSGLDDHIYTVGTAIDALSLPAASGGDGKFTYSLSPQVPGLSFDPGRRELSGTPSEAGVWLMTYSVRDASGDDDWRYFNITVEAATGGGGTTHGVGDTLSDLPTGSWTPNLTGDGGVRTSGGVVTVELDEGTYLEHGGRRYTCQSAAGCTIQDRRITSGTVVQTAGGTAPGGGVSGDHGDNRNTATGVAAESDTEGDLTAGDVDYFRVVVNAAGTLEAYTSGRTDTLGKLEDADGSELSENDDGGSGTNFRISEDVSPGTYFVRVEGFNSRTAGDYTLHVRFTGSSTGTSPSFPAGSSPGNQTYNVGTAISALTLPEASGGDGPLTYSLTPTVPGLSFNATASVRRLTGTPTAAGTYDMTYTARDVDGDTGSLTFAITVQNAGGGGGPTQADLEIPSRLALDVSAGKMYWTDWGTDKIHRANLDGSQVETLISTGLDIPEGLALDVSAGKMYWTDSGTDRIHRANLDGSQVETLISTGLRNPEGLALDVSAGKMYWTTGGISPGSIHRANLDGSQVETLVSGLNFPGPLALDVSAGKLYWADGVVGNHEIHRANLDGSQVETLVSGFEQLEGLALDVSAGKLYWTDLGADKIHRANLDGSQAETLISTGLDNPNGLALDVSAGKMYWTETGADKILRANLAGSQIETLVIPLGSAGPDLVVQSPSASDASPSEGGSFTLSATVRNDGYDESEATTLRYYRSTNSTISSFDTELGTDAVGRLAASATSAESIAITAPSTAGTYYYGACVDSVTGESDTSNNCSSAVRVTVGGGDTQAIPPTPQNLRLTQVGSNVRVTWDSSPGATYYDVWRCNDSVFPCILRSSWRKVGSNITGTTWLDTSAPTPTPGVTVRLQYIVQACNSAGCSGQL